MDLHKVYINHDPGMTLTYFTARSTKVANAFEWKKLVKCNCMGETCWEYANRQKIYVYETILTSGVCLPLPYGYIHVYDHNFLTSTSLKPPGQLKPNFMWSVVRKDE